RAAPLASGAALSRARRSTPPPEERARAGFDLFRRQPPRHGAASHPPRYPQFTPPLTSAGIFLLEDADHRVLEAHVGAFTRWDGLQAVDELEAAELGARRGRAVEDRLARFFRRDAVVTDRLANRCRLGLQPAVVAVEEGERALAFEPMRAVEEVLG